MHPEPVVTHEPVEALVSVDEEAVAISSCTAAPTADVPVNVSVRVDVMLSELRAPVSFAAKRSGVVGAGTR